MKRIAYIFLSILLLLSLYLTWEITRPMKGGISRVSSATIYTTSQGVWNVVNNWRTSSGRLTYTESQILCDIADNRVKQVQDVFNHKQFLEDLKKSNYPYIVSENLSEGYRTPEDTLSAWLNSPPHRWALEQNYKFSCVRCENDYCVQIFSNLERN